MLVDLENQKMPSLEGLNDRQILIRHIYFLQMETNILKKNKTLLLGVIIFSFLLFLVSVGQKPEGVYVSRNYKDNRVLVTRLDTLTLFPNGKAKSSIFRGNAYYKLERHFFGASLIIVYNDGKATFKAPYKNGLFTSSRIVVYSDLNTHYEKIENY